MKISATDPSLMPAAAINKEMQRLSQMDSAVTQAFIDAGRGHEKPSEYLTKSDSLSLRAYAIFKRRGALVAEIERRAGPGMRTLPRGFGPVRKNPTWHQKRRPVKFSATEWTVVETDPKSGFTSHWLTTTEAAANARAELVRSKGMSAHVVAPRMKNPKRGKLTGAAKAAFLARMAKGRKVRRRRVANPKRGPRGEANHAEAKELELYAQNESALYPQKQAIIKNIQRRLKKGTYDAHKAVRLWRYWIDNAATRYRREFSMTGGFNVPTRDAAARAVAEYEIERIRGHEYENPGKRRHSKKFDRCVRKVKRTRRASNAYAVCTATFQRKRVRRKNAKGVVICVQLGHKYFYYTKDNVLSTNESAAKHFGTVRTAALIARQLSRGLPSRAHVSIHSA